MRSIMKIVGYVLLAVLLEFCAVWLAIPVALFGYGQPNGGVWPGVALFIVVLLMPAAIAFFGRELIAGPKNPIIAWLSGAVIFVVLIIGILIGGSIPESPGLPASGLALVATSIWTIAVVVRRRGQRADDAPDGTKPVKEPWDGSTSVMD